MAFVSADMVREIPIGLFWSTAEVINDSDPLLRDVFAAPEWGELSSDGQQWVMALVREVLARAIQEGGAEALALRIKYLGGLA